MDKPFGNVETESGKQKIRKDGKPFNLIERLKNGYLQPTITFPPNPFISRAQIKNRFILVRPVLTEEEKIKIQSIKAETYEEKSKNFAQKNSTAVLEVPKKKEKRVIRSIDRLTASLSNFLIEDIAPFYLSLDIAINEASQSLNLITKDSGISINAKEFLELGYKLTVIKSISKLCEEIQLDKYWEKQMIQSYIDRSFERNPPKNQIVAFEKLLQLIADRKKGDTSKK